MKKREAPTIHHQICDICHEKTNCQDIILIYCPTLPLWEQTARAHLKCFVQDPTNRFKQLMEGLGR